MWGFSPGAEALKFPKDFLPDFLFYFWGRLGRYLPRALTQVVPVLERPAVLHRTGVQLFRFPFEKEKEIEIFLRCCVLDGTEPLVKE